MIEIQVNNLVKSFEVGHNVLDGVTFQIDQGQRVGLLGKNGAGKSTLFKILIGELDCDEGTVTISPGHRMGLISQIRCTRRGTPWTMCCALPSGDSTP